jgi:hypothetical protein
MRDTKYDPCIFYRSSAESGFDGAVVIQIDDSLGVCATEYLQHEWIDIGALSGKPRIILDKNAIRFNGFTI